MSGKDVKAQVLEARWGCCLDECAARQGLNTALAFLNSCGVADAQLVAFHIRAALAGNEPDDSDEQLIEMEC